MLDLIEKFLNEHALISGSFLAFFTSMIRLWRKSNSFFDKLLDSLLCSTMTVGLFYAIQIVHSCPDTVAIAIGSCVGYLGTEKIKEIILRKFDKEINDADK